MNMLIESLVMEFSHESQGTRKTLERLPDNQFAFKPHAKCMDLGSLATHLASIPGWGTVTLKEDVFDMPSNWVQESLKSTAEILKTFDTNVAEYVAQMRETPEASMFAPWTMKVDGKDLFTMPRVAVLRSMIMNHSYHHRAQLGLYLRLLDIPVPSIYGPSADEAV